jgi:heat shock protein HslJ
MARMTSFRLAALTTLAALSLSGCGSTTGSGMGGVPHGEYVLVGIDGGTVPERNITLSVTPEGISGHATCNSYSAQNTATLPAVALTPLVTTKMLCGGMALENRYFEVLQSVNEVEYFGGVLKAKSPSTWLIFEHGVPVSDLAATGGVAGSTTAANSADAVVTVSQ